MTGSFVATTYYSLETSSYSGGRVKQEDSVRESLVERREIPPRFVAPLVTAEYIQSTGRIFHLAIPMSRAWAVGPGTKDPFDTHIFGILCWQRGSLCNCGQDTQLQNQDRHLPEKDRRGEVRRIEVSKVYYSAPVVFLPVHSLVSYHSSSTQTARHPIVP